MAIAKARLGLPDAARKALTRAGETWPPDLREPDSFRVAAPAGVLWFESAEALEQLQREAAELIPYGGP